MLKQSLARFFAGSPDRLISVTAIWVLGLVVSLTALSVSGILINRIFADSRDRLEHNLDAYSQRFQEVLHRANEDAAANIGQRPYLRKILLRRMQGRPHDSDAKDLQEILGVIASGRNIVGIVLEDAQGRPIGSRGSFVEDAAVSAPLANYPNSILSWQDGYVLRTAVPIVDQGVRVGMARMDVRLPELGKVLTYAGIGETGEVVVCAPDGRQAMRCFPHRFSARGYAGPRKRNGKYLPMHYALEGRKDVIKAIDYRGEKVLDAFSPLGKTGLGMVVKMDEAELYLPLQAQLPWLLAAFAALLGGGTYLMRKQLAPLVRSMLHSRSQLQAVVENAADGIITIDVKGNIEGFNPAACTMFGYAPAEVAGLNIGLLLLDRGHNRQEGGIQRYLHADFQQEGREMEALRKDGTRFPVELAVSAMAVDGERKFIVLLRDITERRRAEQALQQSRSMLNRAQAVAHIGSWSINFENGAMELSDENCRIFGIAPGTQITYEDFLAIVHPDDRERVDRAWQAALKGVPFDIDHRIVIGDEFIWVNERAELEFDADGKPLRSVGTTQDITERKLAEARINHLAFYDALTGLPNRTLCQDRLQQAISAAAQHGGEAAAIFIDLDMFKHINDSLGHAAGDRLLQETARRLTACVRGNDTVARLGSDEFVVIMNGAMEGGINMLAQRLLGALREPFTIDGRVLHITCSLGMALYPRDGGNAHALLCNADVAMSRAKEQGRDNARFYTEEMNRKALERFALEEDLRRALAQNEFVLHYQPRVDLRSGEITGLEALVRWQHPEKGLLAPDIFISVAEETGLILPLGEWVLREACTQAKAWENAMGKPVSVAVNLSARQFRQANLIEKVFAILNETGLSPACLELEITESMVMNQAEEVVATLTRLHGLGVRLAIDDFGTGYSSLNYLKRFPVHVLKIDKSFVDGIPSDPGDTTIVTTIISMAHDMKLKVVAEGVESEAQLAFLRKRGCDEMQGYFFSRPVPAQEAESLLSAGRRLARGEDGRAA